jgi:hypothetical protein
MLIEFQNNAVSAGRLGKFRKLYNVGASFLLVGASRLVVVEVGNYNKSYILKF